jgi:hypothetical protein
MLKFHRIAAVLWLFLSAGAVHAALQPCTGGAAPQKWVPCEIDAPALIFPANPYTDLEVKAIITPPAGTTFTKELRGYFAGPNANNYKLRFTPTATGTWSYKVYSPTNSLAYPANNTVTITVGAAPAGKRGFLRRDASFLARPIWDDGTHPFIFGQTYYQLVTNAVATGANGGWKTALANSINIYKMNKVRTLVYPWWKTYAGSFNGGQFYDTQPFSGVRSPCTIVSQAPGATAAEVCPDYNQVSTSHYTALDLVVDQLFVNGQVAELILFKDPAGYPSPIDDNYRTFGINTAQDQLFVKYVLARYGSYPNVIISFANEWENAKVEPGDGAAIVHDEAYYNNTVGPLVRNEDPYYANGSDLRLVTIHGKTASAPSAAFTRATSPTAGWLVHASLQYGVHSPSPTLPDKWGSDIRSANGANVLAFDDEFGYLSQLSSVDHRRAIWGLATAEVFGSIGDIRSSPNQSIRGDWADAPTEYGDIRRMIDFFTATNRTPNVTNWWRMIRRTDVFNTPARRVWAMGQSNVQFVLYDAIGSTNFTITLRAPPAGQAYKIWYYDPSTDPAGNAYTSYSASSFGGGALTITIPAGRTGVDTVYLIKAQ